MLFPETFPNKSPSYVQAYAQTYINRARRKIVGGLEIANIVAIAQPIIGSLPLFLTTIKRSRKSNDSEEPPTKRQCHPQDVTLTESSPLSEIEDITFDLTDETTEPYELSMSDDTEAFTTPNAINLDSEVAPIFLSWPEEEPCTNNATVEKIGIEQAPLSPSFKAVQSPLFSPGVFGLFPTSPPMEDHQLDPLLEENSAENIRLNHP